MASALVVLGRRSWAEKAECRANRNADDNLVEHDNLLLVPRTGLSHLRVEPSVFIYNKHLTLLATRYTIYKLIKGIGPKANGAWPSPARS
jgi:hypothetical protein